MLIFLKLVTSKTVAYDFNPESFVFELKLYLLDFYGIYCCQQVLMFNGQRMEDYKKLRDYGIINENAMVLVLEEAWGYWVIKNYIYLISNILMVHTMTCVWKNINKLII